MKAQRPRRAAAARHPSGHRAGAADAAQGIQGQRLSRRAGGADRRAAEVGARAPGACGRRQQWRLAARGSRPARPAPTSGEDDAAPQHSKRLARGERDKHAGAPRQAHAHDEGERTSKTARHASSSRTTTAIRHHRQHRQEEAQTADRPSRARRPVARALAFGSRFARLSGLVRPRGLEPPRVAPLAPQASASTNSAMAALGKDEKSSKTSRPNEGGPCNK